MKLSSLLFNIIRHLIRPRWEKLTIMKSFDVPRFIVKLALNQYT